MKRVALFVALWFCLAAMVPQTLVWTNPQFVAAVDDSGVAYCDVGTDTLRYLSHVEVWGQPSFGGPARHITDVSTWNRAGLVDSVVVDREFGWVSWHYWVYPVDMLNHRAPCPSNIVLSRGTQVTGVGDGAPPRTAVKVQLFDVLGRRVDGTLPRASGVYFKRTTWSDGTKTVVKEVYVK